MYAINYTDSRIIEIKNSTQMYEFENWDKAETVKEARNKIKDYWETVKQDAEMNIKNANSIQPV